jgi:phage tail sheath protein FI
MPVTPTFPGVYIEEIPSGVHTITGVATSIAAFVDTFERGPVNYAVQLLSLTDFENIMGGLDTTSEASYAIQQFFLNGGTECYAVRVGYPPPLQTPAASIDVLDKPAGGARSFTATAGRMVGNNLMINPGAWGNNVRLEVNYDTTDPVTLFNLSISEVDPSTGNILQSEVYRNLNLKSGDPAYAVDVVNNGSRIVFLTAPASPNLPSASGTLSGPLPALPFPASVKNNAQFEITTNVDGTTNSYVCTLTLPSPPPTDYPGLRPYLENAVRTGAPKTSSDTANNPLLTGVSVQLIGNQFMFVAGRGGTTSFKPDSELTPAVHAADTFAKDLSLDATSAKPRIVNIQQYSLNGKTLGAQNNGKDGTFDITQIKNASIRGLEANKTGFYALDDVDLFNILCLPVATRGGASVKFTDTDVSLILNEAKVYCDIHRAMLIVDLPSDVKDVPSMQTWMTQNSGFRDTNSAVYFPRVRLPDPLNGSRLRDVASSGTLAGLWAATDVSRGVWKAPAGVDVQLVNVQQLVYNLVDRENGVLNPLGINCLRTFPVYGNVSWGARTLFGADVQGSEWKYIPVRRLALFLEETLFRGTKWVVFEPNDEPLWAQIRMNVTSFMHDLFRQGAFQGQTPSQAYLVKCDSEINTQFEIDRGIVNILVGFAPLKPAEFVILQIQQLTGQTPA